MFSNCCGASEWMEDTSICRDCKEYAVFTDDEEGLVFNQAQKNYMDNYRNGCRGCECMTQSNCQNKK